MILFIFIRLGKYKYSNHDDSNNDFNNDEFFSLSKIFSARPLYITSPIGDSSDEVYNLP